MFNVDPSVADNPIILYAILAVGVLGIIFGGITKGTTGFGAWLNSLRRIGSESKSADLKAKNIQIVNLAEDLEVERNSRQLLDDKIQDHVQWDWKVYNVLVKAGLLEEGDKPPPLH